MGDERDVGGGATTATGPEYGKYSLAIMRIPCRELSYGAKTLYVRLTLFAGRDGACYPSHDTLAAALGTTRRHVIELAQELRDCRLVEWKRRRTSSSYTLYPPEAFRSRDVQDRAQHDANEPAQHDVQDRAHKKMSLKRGSSKDKRDIDCPPTNRKERDKSADRAALPPSKERQYPRVREVVARYMADDPKHPQKEDYPSYRKVVEIMAAAHGETEDDVIRCLRHCYEDRGLRPGTRNGPRSFNWFPTVVQEFFDKERDRYDAAHPGFDGWEERNGVRVDRMDAEMIVEQAAAFDPVSRK